MKSTLTQDIVRLAMLGVLVSSGNAMAQTWTSTDVQVLHGSRYMEPSNPNHVNKTILTIENTAGWSWGKTFFFVDTLKSGNQEIGASSGNPESPLEIYGEGYGYLSLSKLSGTKLAFGPIADINLAAGINAGRKNSELRPRPLAYLAGISFDAALPFPGFASLDVLAYDDHGRTIFGKPNYKTTYQITPAWGIPFEFGGMGFEFNGFIDFIGSRGQGTVSQILMQPQLLVDVGRYWGMPKHAFSVGIEYQHWRNKFGIQGVKESTPQIMLKWKL